jgi:DNA-binding MarR family transcriptional regulator
MMNAALETGSADPMRPAVGDLKLEEFLPYRLNVLAVTVSQALSRLYTERYGIGVPEWRVLATLGQFGVMTGKAIGSHSRMHKTNVSRAVAALTRRKLVMRRTHNDDLREAFLSLTLAGRGIYDEIAPVAVDFARELMASVDPADRPALDRALKNLTECATQLSNKLASSPSHR